MKKNVVYAAVCLFFAIFSVSSCKTEHKENINKHTEAYIRERIDTIYATVGKPFIDSEGNEKVYIENPFNRDSAYCTERYYALMKEAARLCDETDDILYDYDYWVCGQDYSDDWSCTVARVYDITDSTAMADLNIHNFSDIETTIALRFERDDWYIDDFNPAEGGFDDKAYLLKTISECKEALAKEVEALTTDDNN